VLGKSLVGGSVTGDVFENVTAEAVPFSRPAISGETLRGDVSVDLGGPWSYYAEFRRIHGLEHLSHPEPPEIALQAGTLLVIPLWLRNGANAAREVTVSVDAPAGWKVENGAGKFKLAPKQWAAGRVEITLPVLAEASETKEDPREVTVRAESDGQNVGVAKLRVELRKRALPE